MLALRDSLARGNEVAVQWVAVDDQDFAAVAREDGGSQQAGEAGAEHDGAAAVRGD